MMVKKKKKVEKNNKVARKYKIDKDLSMGGKKKQKQKFTRMHLCGQKKEKQ